MSRNEAILVDGLCKSYGSKKAVDALSFSVGRGEFFSLLGVNGAGKSTAIRMLSGVTKPDAGDAWLMGCSLRSQPADVKRHIGVSPQESAVAEKLSVRENLQFIAEIHGKDLRQARLRAEAVIEEFGMEEIASQKAGTLSGGWQRRLSIAMALVPQPQVLFLDEPTLGLDVIARRELWKVLQGLRGRVSILMTTHYMEEAEQLSERIGIMQKGRLVALGTPRELMQQAGAARFEEAFIALAAPEEGEVDVL